MNTYTLGHLGSYYWIPQHVFRYVYCLNTETLNDRTEQVESVQFNISRYHKYKKVLEFKTPLTIKSAIEKVEEYLSQPLIREYYQVIKDDTFHNYEWGKAQKNFACRGDCLTDSVFLEAVSWGSHTMGRFTLHCFS